MLPTFPADKHCTNDPPGPKCCWTGDTFYFMEGNGTTQVCDDEEANTIARKKCGRTGVCTYKLEHDTHTVTMKTCKTS